MGTCLLPASDPTSPKTAPGWEWAADQRGAAPRPPKPRGARPSWSLCQALTHSQNTRALLSPMLGHRSTAQGLSPRVGKPPSPLPGEHPARTVPTSTLPDGWDKPLQELLALGSLPPCRSLLLSPCPQALPGPHPGSWHCSSGGSATSGADFPSKATFGSGMQEPLRETPRERRQQPDRLRMWWLNREESGAGGAEAAEASPRPDPAKNSLAVALGTRLRRAGSTSCREPRRSMTSPPRASDEEGKEETSLFLGFLRMTFGQAFPRGESATHGQHHSPFPRQRASPPGDGKPSQPTRCSGSAPASPGRGDGYRDVAPSHVRAAIHLPKPTSALSQGHSHPLGPAEALDGVVTVHPWVLQPPHPSHTLDACSTELERLRNAAAGIGKRGQGKLCPG